MIAKPTVSAMLGLFLMCLPADAGQDEDGALTFDPALRWRCIKILRDGLRSDEFWPSMHAAEALTQVGFGHVVLFALRDRLGKETNEQSQCGLAREQVRAGKPELAQVMLSILPNKESKARIHAAESLYKVRQIGDGNALRTALDEGDAVLEMMAAAALFRGGDKAVLARVRRYLASKDSRERYIAAWILGRLGDRSDWPALQKLAGTEAEPFANSFIVNALAQLGAPGALEKIVENLMNKDEKIRRYAAQTVGDCRAIRFMDKLVPLLRDEDPDTAIRAAQSILLISASLLEEDSDGDTVPDVIERELGTPIDSPEPLEPVCEAKPRPIGDKDPDLVAPQMVRAWFAHVGGKRCLWKFQFDRAYSELRTVFHVYADLDNDRSNGRQGSDWVRGVDVMYSFERGLNDPRIFTPSVRVDSLMPVRGVCAGDTIWVCDDVHIATEGGHTSFRMRTLSERRPPDSNKVISSQSTPAKVIRAKMHPDRALPRVPYPTLEGFRSVPPSYELRRTLRYAKSTVRLDPTEADVRGAVLQHNGEVAFAGGTDEAATFPLSANGEYRVAFYGYASSSAASGLVVTLDDRPVGRVAVGRCSGPGRLLYSEAPLTVTKGSRLSVRGAERSGAGRYRDFMLITSEPKFPALRIENVQSAVLPAPPGKKQDLVEIAWTTNRPAECTVTVASEKGESQKLPEGRGRTENHRLYLPSEMADGECRVRVEAKEDGGERVVSAFFAVPTRRGAPKGKRRRTEIHLSVHEPTGHDRVRWPIRTGIPLPAGMCVHRRECRLLDPQGQLAAAQLRPLAHWPDGSVKWLLADFLASTRAGHAVRYTLVHSDERIGFESFMSVEDGVDAITVDTGALRVRLMRDRFDPFAFVERNGKPLTEPTARGILVSDGHGKHFASAWRKPDEMVVEEAGPVRTTVRVSGPLVNKEGQRYLRYLCRLHFYAGQPWVRTVLSTDNDVPKPRMNLVSAATLHIRPSALRACGFGFGPKEIVVGDASVLQDYDSRCTLSIGDRTVTEKRAPGFCSLLTGAGSMIVAVRDFWQLHPKGFGIDRGGLSIGLLPRLPAEQYEDCKDKALVDRLYYWCDKGRYKLATGVRVTTELFFDFAPQADPAVINAWVQHPLFAACTPEHYCASGVAGPLAPRRAGAFEPYEANLDKAFKGFLERREQVREYGFMNYGDWYGERRWNWGNIEYDTQHALALNFMRTGNLDMLWAAEDAEWHNADIDTVHHSSRPSDIGRVYTHCLGHTGGYFSPDYKGMGAGFANGPKSMGHTWARGHFLLWALTGEQRYRDTGDKVARQIATQVVNSSGIGRSRGGGWALIAVTGAYQMTGDPFYLNAARILVRKILEKQGPNGQWGHFIWECRDHTPKHWGCKPFMTGVILHGLSMHDRIEPTAAVKDAIVRGAAYLWDHTYVEKDRGFIYAECTSFTNRGGIWTIPLNGDGLARACRLDPKHRYRRQLTEACAQNLHVAGVGSFGKSFTQATCFMPYLFKELTDLGITSLPKPTTPDGVWVRSAVVLPPGGRMALRPRVSRNSEKPAQCSLELGPGAQPWLAGSRGVLRWEAPPGVSDGPEVKIRASKNPQQVRVPMTLRCGETKIDMHLSLEAVTPLARGTRVGWLTSPTDHLRLAAERVGGKVEPIEDLRSADLSLFRTIVAGAEGFEKDFGNCREHSVKLLRFVAAGGRLVCGQVNDQNWRPDFLPYDLHLGDEETESGKILAPDHPLFSSPNKVPSLAGVTSYDRIVATGPEWRVLMRAQDGTPSIVEARVGKGEVLVIMPSFDRPVYNASEEPEATAACTAFIENLLAYCAK